MEFQLYGGAADGVVLPFPLKAPGAVYLVRMPRPEQCGGGWDVLAYRFGNRTDEAGRWVLVYERQVGTQGAGSAEILKWDDGKEAQP